jgi:hypothetical protein
MRGLAVKRGMKASTAVGAAIAMLAVCAMTATAGADTSTCLELSRLERTKAIDNRTIIATMKGRDQYRKIALAANCGGLKFHDAFSYATPEPRLCEGESITVLRASSVCGIAEISRIPADEARHLLAIK